MTLEKYSIGAGDRFGHQGKALLQAVIEAKKRDLDVAMVWNKSYREHTVIGTDPSSVRKAADAAVSELNWKGSYYVDADHIGLSNVDRFLESSDYFTLDVADFIGKRAPDAAIETFARKYQDYPGGKLSIPGIPRALHITNTKLQNIALKYLLAVKQAGCIYRYIEKRKGRGNFITEVSMDETSDPQNAEELLFILAALADEGVPVQTLAPRFPGRFNKGVDYVGDLELFAQEFEKNICVISYAVAQFNLPDNLKLSIHSGSDKFSLYPIIRGIIKKHDAGLHIKTAGTTWLEELLGLAESGEEGVRIVCEVYEQSLNHYLELCRPYAAVIDIDPGKLPNPRSTANWSSQQWVQALRHNPAGAAFNPHLRQLLHVGYKIAAGMGERYLDALKRYKEQIAEKVTENMWKNHLEKIFLSGSSGPLGIKT